jgi:hypothetical protein
LIGKGKKSEIKVIRDIGAKEVIKKKRGQLLCIAPILTFPQAGKGKLCPGSTAAKGLELWIVLLTYNVAPTGLGIHGASFFLPKCRSYGA